MNPEEVEKAGDGDLDDTLRLLAEYEGDAGDCGGNDISTFSSPVRSMTAEIGFDRLIIITYSHFFTVIVH